jgi:hypothetical protein
MAIEKVIVNQTVEKVTVAETKNKVNIITPGIQGPRGRTILNGTGAPANNNGLQGDFYYDTTTTNFYGPKLSDGTWAGAEVIKFIQEGADYAYHTSWEIGQVTGPVDGVYSVELTHNLGFFPNVTVKTSAGDVLETGIDYNSTNKITLTMAQPFSGTAYLS